MIFRRGIIGRWVIGALLIAGVIGGCVFAVLRIARPLVTVSEPVEGPAVQAFYATGTIAADKEYPIRANVAGIIDTMNVDRGSAVKKGDVLAVVLSDDLQLKMRQAQADLDEKRLRFDEKTSPVLHELDQRITALKDILAIAQREADREQSLISHHAASQQDLDRALDRMKSAWGDSEAALAQRESKKLELQRDLAFAQAAYDIAKWSFDQQTIRSPIDGVVLDFPAARGTRVAINDHLMQIADLSQGNLVMRAQVDEEDKLKVQPDQVVWMTLYSFPDRVMKGNVSKIYDKADPERRTFMVDIRMDEGSGQLAAGMTGELEFVVAAKEKTMVIPSQAVQDGNVWIVRDGRLARSDAKTGIRGVERVEILSGLHAGEAVVISPIGTLEAGQLVRTEAVDPRVAADLNKPKKGDAAFKGFGG